MVRMLICEFKGIGSIPVIYPFKKLTKLIIIITFTRYKRKR